MSNDILSEGSAGVAAVRAAAIKLEVARENYIQAYTTSVDTDKDWQAAGRPPKGSKSEKRAENAAKRLIVAENSLLAARVEMDALVRQNSPLREKWSDVVASLYATKN